MKDDTEQKQVGLGKVIYSVDSDQAPPMKEAFEADKEINEDSKESFPASDPPAFSGSTATPNE